MYEPFPLRFQSELLTVSKAVKSPLYRYDSGGGEGGERGKAVVQGPEAQYPVENDDEDWGFASAFLFALSLITTVGKGTFTTL